MNIFILEDHSKKYPEFTLETNKQLVIKINIFELSNYKLNCVLDKINDILSIYPKIKTVNIIFENKIVVEAVNKVLAKLNNILYSYYPKNKKIKLYQVKLESKNLMEQISEYKDIVMDPSKTPDTYLEWIKTNTPSNYVFNSTNLSQSELFPLTKAVGAGSKYNSYFVHIRPKNEIASSKNVYLVGKAITYDAGGMNIKDHSMVDMKADMSGSGIILAVLKIMAQSKLDTKLNIHLVIPIAENMIGPSATKPSEVVKTMGGKLVEITNTDAEGRLCLSDGIEYVNLYLAKDKNPENCLIIDIATLTGNTKSITNGISSLIITNKVGENIGNKIIEIGENIGEYLDTIKIREEYEDLLKSPVADIRNVNLKERAGCILGAQYLHYFTNDLMPWIHLDIASSAFTNSKSQSYGINLLLQFLKSYN